MEDWKWECGTTKGITWMKTKKNISERYVHEETRQFQNGSIVIFPYGIDEKTAQKYIQHIDRYIDRQITNEYDAKYFDYFKEFPGLRVTFYSSWYIKSDINEYLDKYTGIDVSNFENKIKFEHNSKRKCVYIIVRESKNGVSKIVKRRLDKSLKIEEAVNKALSRYKNKTMVDIEEKSTIMCGPHLNQILRCFTKTALDVVKSWIEMPFPNDGSGIKQMYIPSVAYKKDIGIISCQIKMSEKQNIVMANILLKSDASITDDPTGSNVLVSNDIPETVKGGLTERDFGKTFGVKWAEGLTIKTIKDDLALKMRLSYEHEAIVYPESEDDLDIARKDLQDFIESKDPNARNLEKTILYNEPVGYLISDLEAPKLNFLLHSIIMQEDIDMACYGKPDWILRYNFGNISVQRSPKKKLVDIIENAITKSSTGENN
jgi:hypothetical protein